MNNDKKKILTIDGGGIRGLLAVGMLEQIESQLRKATQNPEMLLSDYFDYISGTSTGAILATALSTGMSTAEIRPFYLECSKEIFKKASLSKRLYFKYKSEEITKILKNTFGEKTTLGSDSIKTLLMIVMRNATTGSPWLMSNNPDALFNQRNLLDCNLDLPLWQLVRASTAAPSFFEPESITLGDTEFLFVDGGITPYNNPSFQTFLMATLEPYKIKWETGEDKMLLVSVGTGGVPDSKDKLSTKDMHLAYTATQTPQALMNAASAEQDILCRSFGNCLCGDEIDMEIGNMLNMQGPTKDKLFTYMRYNTNLTAQGLEAIGITDIDPKILWEMDNTKYLDELNHVGEMAASHKVKTEHFTGFY
ncbi:MAG: patatin-like phospholipase family protein [Cocleimonas sp.]